MDISMNYDYGRELVEGFELEEFAAFVIASQGLPDDTEVSISFVDNDEMAQLNGEYRGKEGPTDVLSFECDNLDDDFASAGDGEDAPYELGDVIIAPDVAAAQAIEYGTTLREEIELLCVHGLLHLCGYDHLIDAEAEVMEARERELLAVWRGRSGDAIPHVSSAPHPRAGDDDAHSMGGQVDGPFRSGFVTLIGRPNAGKSTLLNAVMGKKIAITSDTAQTTRHRFRAVYTQPGYQLVLVDTPGLHKPHDALGEELNESALQALDGIDAVAFLLDASKPAGRGDEWVAAHVRKVRAPKILVVTKTDLVDEATVEAQVAAAADLAPWDAVVRVASPEGIGVQDFVDTVAALLPEGPQWFPADMETDQPIEVITAEFIREKILRSFSDEVPHAIGVVVEQMEYDRKKKLERIYAYIYVERESQKGIIIGKGGSALKAVGSDARADLEHLLGRRVFLDLRVKVRKNWRRDLNQIRRFGYGEGI